MAESLNSLCQVARYYIEGDSMGYPPNAINIKKDSVRKCFDHTSYASEFMKLAHRRVRTSERMHLGKNVELKGDY
jgi:hypothetical protein